MLQNGKVGTGIKILVISPYVGLKDLFLEVNEQLGKEIDVYVGDLFEGLAIAKSLEHQGYDLVISRGATAKLLQKHLLIPVVEIPMTGYDILRTLTLLKGYSGKIGMMSYLNNIPGAHTIGQLLNMDITFYPIDKEEEIEHEIERASNEGVKMIIGDVITTTTAAKFGIQAILITSGKEAIIETIATAEQLLHYVKKERGRTIESQTASVRFNTLVAESEKMKQLIEIAKKVSRSHLPIIIYGEKGTGKESLAQAIHNYSERQSWPYIYIHCEAYSNHELQRRLANAFENKEGGTIVLQALEALPYHLQGALLQQMNKNERMRLIVLAEEPLDEAVKKREVRKDLNDALKNFTLKIPPLRDRKEDFNDLVRIFIASSNLVTKKQISGFHDNVLKEMKELLWPANVAELKWTVEQMCMLTDGPFIRYEDVKALLSELKTKTQNHDEQQLSIIGKTLQQIENEVIQMTLRQENYNQSKAAKRLGINRSTLWRKIKMME